LRATGDQQWTSGEAGQRGGGDTASITGERLVRLEGVKLTDIKEVEEEGDRHKRKIVRKNPNS
jgi:hypothetical protein